MDDASLFQRNVVFVVQIGNVAETSATYSWLVFLTNMCFLLTTNGLVQCSTTSSHPFGIGAIDMD